MEMNLNLNFKMRTENTNENKKTISDTRCSQCSLCSLSLSLYNRGLWLMWVHVYSLLTGTNLKSTENKRTFKINVVGLDHLKLLRGVHSDHLQK